MTDQVLIQPFEQWHALRPFQELAVAFCAAFGHGNVESVDHMIRREMHQGHHWIVASIKEHEVAGFISWRYWGEPRHRLAELYHIGVIPTVHGLGRQLIPAMEHAVHDHYQEFGLPGARRIFILTHAENVRAQNLYKRCGFEHQATLPEFFHPRTDDSTGEEFYFAKSYPTVPVP